MLKNYFLVALRTFRRNKTFSFINVIGLSIGISASLVIFLLVQYDFTFDKFEKDGARIYRVVAHGKNNGATWQNGCLSEPMGAAAKKEVSGLEIVAPIRTLDETRVSRLLAWATGLTIFISCLGLLGLVIYVTNQRTKEIGIRKVIGASVTNLIILLSRDFLQLIGLAILIAVPISWWGSRKWLENFAYKTSRSPGQSRQ
jgi:hypothetical protein